LRTFGKGTGHALRQRHEAGLEMRGQLAAEGREDKASVAAQEYRPTQLFLGLDDKLADSPGSRAQLIRRARQRPPPRDTLDRA
jgi:hypothetical protein